jgi:hypothetical protein
VSVRAAVARVTPAVAALAAAVSWAASPVAVAGARSCSSYPRPGTVVAGPTPSALADEYGVLRRRARSGDRLPARILRTLPESGIVAGGVRLVGRATYGRLYLVPARHILDFRLAPARCLPRAQRSPERALRPRLVSEYAHRGLCLVIIAGTTVSPTCAAAPGTVAPLMFAPGSPGFGLTPDGVAAVRVSYNGSHSRRARVRGNVWLINDPLAFRPPCGLVWLNAGGTVLRTVQTCTVDLT